MKVICVILCLIISATTAYADNALWSTVHASTNLIKDEQWLESALQAEEPVSEPLQMEATMEEPEKDTSTDPPLEGLEERVEDISSTPSEIDIEPILVEDIHMLQDEPIEDGEAD